MKFLAAAWLLLCAFPLLAQTASTASIPETTLGKQPWEVGVFAGGAFNADGRYPDNYSFLQAGVRLGKVLTPNVGHGWYRGNFEYALDVIPVYPVFHRNANQYGAGMNPVVLKWNFTNGKKLAPYGELAGGFIVTQRDLPISGSSSFNFVSHLGGGVQYFVRPKRSLSFAGSVFHLSNASIGDLNPGFNLGLQFTVGYHWWK